MFHVYLVYADQSSSHYSHVDAAGEAERAFRDLLANPELRGLDASAVLTDASRPLYVVRLDGPVDPQMHLVVHREGTVRRRRKIVASP